MKKLTALLFLLLFIQLSASTSLFSHTNIVKESENVRSITHLHITVANSGAVTQFIERHFLKTFFDSPFIKANLTKDIVIGDTNIIRYDYKYKGIPINGIWTTVTVQKGHIVRIDNGLENMQFDVSHIISSSQAVQTAMKQRHLTTLPTRHISSLMIMKVAGEWTPVYRVSFTPIAPFDRRFHIIHAQSGRHLYRGNLIFFADEDTTTIDDEVTDSDITEVPDEIDAPTDMALMYQFNPERTADRISVALPWVSLIDDAALDSSEQGFLTAVIDDNDIRKIKAYNCPDNGEKVDIGPLVGISMAVMLPICSPKQLANKVDNNSFVYNDCHDGMTYNREKMNEKDIDRCAEVSMYYHTAKVYDFLRNISSEFEYLNNNTEDKPLNLIANFQMPEMDQAKIMNGTAQLTPMDNAFYSPEDPTLSALLSTSGISGNLLVFGQGTKADFGLDGDVVYHEFGHAIIHTTGLDSNGFVDKYGFNNEPGSLHEGLADSFSMMLTNDPCTGEYASKGIVDMVVSGGGTIEMDRDGDFYCMRHAKNSYTVFEDLNGEVHWDGQPMLAVNWTIFQWIKDKKIGGENLAEHQKTFAELLLKVLYSLGTAEGTYKQWGTTLQTVIEDDTLYKDIAKDVVTLITERGFFTDIRSRKLTAEKPIKAFYVAQGASSGGIGDVTGGSGGLTIEEDEKEIEIGTSYLQLLVTLPEGSNSIKLSGVAAAGGGGLVGGGSDPVLKLYYRAEKPVEYHLTKDKAATVDKDGISSDGKGVWNIENIAPGTYYLQFINSAGAGVVQNLSVAFYTAEIETPDEDSDTATSMEDDPIPDETNHTAPSSGCSSLII
ncbi:hypothetical protein KAH37_03985 [bacterium]|nr:hypothetical protein [bacterium]